MKPEDLRRLKADIKEILPRLNLMFDDVMGMYEDCPETKDMLTLHYTSLAHACKARALPKVWYEARVLEDVLIFYLTE